MVYTDDKKVEDLCKLSYSNYAIVKINLFSEVLDHLFKNISNVRKGLKRNETELVARTLMLVIPSRVLSK